MSADADRKRDAVIERVLHGAGVVPAEGRRAAFDNAGVDPRARTLVDTIARNAWKVTDEQVAAARAAGLSDDEIFELAVAAALGQATRQRASALAALAAAVAAEATERGERR